ncbi:hypothetical protein B4119_1459 [Parageobacillus caldoxylosilyticus]|uniref:Uncharacterized protein n=1 Tax=Saccharococcus caldoxylosilyticus TaxID=81408 RepID=A0A150KY40_9BACL|nr:hypothetical protein B4119_1459 [Parageobacillus caldoxylosilyticus]
MGTIIIFKLERIPVFLKTRFNQWLFGFRREIERVFKD